MATSDRVAEEVGHAGGGGVELMGMERGEEVIAIRIKYYLGNRNLYTCFD